MFNKSAIFKAAHSAAAYERKMFMPKGKETYAVTFGRMLKKQWYLAKLNVPAEKTTQIVEADLSPELEALKFEHYRRDLSSKHYFGSRQYHQTKDQIQQLEQAA